MEFSTRAHQTDTDVLKHQNLYPSFEVPIWWLNAKLGIFLHWGLYSLPAWARVPRNNNSFSSSTNSTISSNSTSATNLVNPQSSTKSIIKNCEIWEYANHTYAEWIGNTCRIPHSPAQIYLQKQFGAHFHYEQLANIWNLPNFSADSLLASLHSFGARYVIPTAKHHDGFCLWNTATTSFNSYQTRPGVDLLAEIAQAANNNGLKFGIYYSGALDWHVSNFPPITSNEELFAYRRNDPKFALFCTQQVKELFNNFRPEIFWNDIDWPDAAKISSADPNYSLWNLLQTYQRLVPTGVVNDRLGIPLHGFLTREYAKNLELIPQPWEACRGLGHSFGFNQLEGVEDILNGFQIVKLLARTLTHGGNLLLNIGLTAQGEIPELYLPSLEFLGNWLKTHGCAIYQTRPVVIPGSPNKNYGFVQVSPDSKHNLLYFSPESSQNNDIKSEIFSPQKPLYLLLHPSNFSQFFTLESPLPYQWKITTLNGQSVSVLEKKVIDLRPILKSYCTHKYFNDEIEPPVVVLKVIPDF